MQSIIDQQIAGVESFGFQVESLQRKLATLYWTAKMHKVPPKERFIASSSKCVTKVLSQCLSKCLMAVQKQLQRQCGLERAGDRSKAKRFWIVNSTEEALAKVKQVNSSNTAKTVDSFDFSTLYTVLEHESLLRELEWVVRKAFASSGKQYLAVYERTASFVHSAK